MGALRLPGELLPTFHHISVRSLPYSDRPWVPGDEKWPEIALSQVYNDYQDWFSHVPVNFYGFIPGTSRGACLRRARRGLTPRRTRPHERTRVAEETRALMYVSYVCVLKVGAK